MQEQSVPPHNRTNQQQASSLSPLPSWRRPNLHSQSRICYFTAQAGGGSVSSTQSISGELESLRARKPKSLSGEVYLVQQTRSSQSITHIHASQASTSPACKPCRSCSASATGAFSP